MNHKRKFGVWRTVETDFQKIPPMALKIVVRVPLHAENLVRRYCDDVELFLGTVK